MRLRGAVVVLLSLPLAACGADGVADSAPPPSRAEVAVQVAGLWKRVSPAARKAAPCVGRAVSRSFSAEQLRAAGILDAEYVAARRLPVLQAGVARGWVKAWFGCVDVIAVTARAQAKDTPGLDVPGFERCVRTRITRRQLRAAAMDGLTGRENSRAVAGVSTVLFRCARQHR